MAYADKCFYFDWGNRKIELEDFGMYDEITVRRRNLYNEDDEPTKNVSIELWGANKSERPLVLKELKQHYKKCERFMDDEIVLSRDNAMALATKLLRAVAELDANDYMEDLLYRVENLELVNLRKLDELKERRDKKNIEQFKGKKGGIMGALENYLDTKIGEDAVKEMKEIKENKEKG